MLPTLLVRLYSIAYLWVRVVGCNHEFGYHLTDIDLTERHFVISSLRPDHTAMNKLPKMTTVALCTNPTSPRCDHDNHHHKPPTLLMGYNRKRDSTVIHQVSLLSLTTFTNVLTKLNSSNTFHYDPSTNTHLSHHLYIKSSSNYQLEVCRRLEICTWFI